MSISHLLQDFDQLAEDLTKKTASEKHSEEDLLASFEQGYKAGWDDAISAKTGEQANISTDLARNLQDLSFTYHEARESMMADLAPTIEKALMTVMPEVARHSVGALAVEQLTAIIRENSETKVLLSTSPQAFDAVNEVMPEDLRFPVEVVQDDSLQEGQVRFEFDQRERLIDLGEVLETLSNAFAAFSHETRKEAQNG